MAQSTLLVPQNAHIPVSCALDAGVHFLRLCEAPRWDGERAIIVTGSFCERLVAARFIWDALFAWHHPAQQIIVKIVVPRELPGSMAGAVACWLMDNHEVLQQPAAFLCLLLSLFFLSLRTIVETTG